MLKGEKSFFISTLLMYNKVRSTVNFDIKRQILSNIKETISRRGEQTLIPGYTINKNPLKKNIVFYKPEEFDKRPGPFCMSFGFDLKSLMTSIKTAGLINEPFVRRNNSGFLDIVSGYRRILALLSLNWDTIPCVDLTESGMTDADMLIFNLHDNISIRSFNNLEKYMIIKRLLSYISIESIYEHYMDILNISNRREIELLIKFEGLTEELKNVVAKGRISMKALENLLDMKTPDVIIILKYITDLNLNFNQQLLFIELISDISIREDANIYTVLAEEVFSKFINGHTNNNPQRAKRLLDLARARRFPIITENEKAFNKQVSDINLPKNTRIKQTPFFEGPNYMLEISFKDGEELKDTIGQLAKTKGIENIKDPWRAI
jgi:hypothetical protein